MESAEKKNVILFLGLLFTAIHIIGLTGAMGPNFLEGKNDFAAFYMGAKLSGRGHLFDADGHYAGQQRELDYYMPAVTFIQLPFYAALLKPLAWFDYGTAWRLSLLANAACAIWFYWKFLWGIRRPSFSARLFCLPTALSPTARMYGSWPPCSVFPFFWSEGNPISWRV